MPDNFYINHSKSKNTGKTRIKEINPYAAPESNIELEDNSEISKLLRRIREGVFVAVMVGILTIATNLNFLYKSGIFHKAGFEYLSYWMVIEGGLLLVLVFGISKKSRIASTTMFVYYLVSKVTMIIQSIKFTDILVGIVFLYFLYQAMIATYEYHKLTNKLE